MADFHIDWTLYEGREGVGERLEREILCYDLLEKLEIPFWRVDHDAADTLEDCKIVEEVIGVGVYKNLFLCNRGKNRFYLLMMPADKPFKTRVFSKLVGSPRLSFADGEHMMEYLGLTPGSVSLLGLMHDKAHAVTLALDADVLRGEYIRFHPCINTSTLKLRTADVVEKLLPALDHKPLIVEQPWVIEEDAYKKDG